MSSNEMISILYGYSRAVCKTTSLDYRDVAHMVAIKLLPDIRNDKIKHIKSYIYTTIKNLVSQLLKSRYSFVRYLDSKNTKTYYDHHYNFAIDNIFQNTTKREQFIILKTLEGYTRQEIADILGTTRNCINIIWCRMIERLRGNQ